MTDTNTKNDISTFEALAALGEKIVNDNTTVGKTGKTLLWSGITCILLALMTTIVGNPTLFSWHSGILVVAANVGLVFLKNILDEQTPNI